MSAICGGIIAALGWFALALQLPLSIAAAHANGHSTAWGFITYFSFFTILTNLLVSFSLTAQLLTQGRSLGRLFSEASLQGALALYIAIVGIVYSLVLRNIWNPESLQKVADIILHDIVPLAFVMYWLVFAPRVRLPWKSAIVWLAYPGAYLIYTLVRGARTGWYPYPFMNVKDLGYVQVAMNSTAMLAGFVALGLLLVAITRWRARHID